MSRCRRGRDARGSSRTCGQKDGCPTVTHRPHGSSPAVDKQRGQFQTSVFTGTMNRHTCFMAPLVPRPRSLWGSLVGPPTGWRVSHRRKMPFHALLKGLFCYLAQFAPLCCILLQ